MDNQVTYYKYTQGPYKSLYKVRDDIIEAVISIDNYSTTIEICTQCEYFGRPGHGETETTETEWNAAVQQLIHRLTV